jgi:hypothetical protein
VDEPIYPFYPYNHPGLVLADAECAVLKGDLSLPGFSGHCGYCVFPKEEIPETWHGNYNADGLYGVDAHGGLTYAEIEGGDAEQRRNALKALWAEKEARYAERKAGGLDFISLWSEYHDRGKALAKTFPYTHVVFGFDTAHYGDGYNGALHSSEYVMQLARHMRASIAELAKSALLLESEAKEPTHG